MKKLNQFFNQNTLSKYVVIVFIIFFQFLLNSCQMFDMISGSNIDEERFALHREAKIKELRYNKSLEIEKRLKGKDLYEESDFSIILSNKLINEFMTCYNGTKGYLNKTTSYTIDSTKVKLENGCAISSVYMKCYESEYKLNVDLVMDALVIFKKDGDYLTNIIEPFNITPIVDRGVSVLSPEAIANLIRINTADMNQKMPPIRIPMTISKDFEFDKVDFVIRENLNFRILSTERKMSYDIKSNEPIILKDKIIVNLYIDNFKIN